MILSGALPGDQPRHEQVEGRQRLFDAQPAAVRLKRSEHRVLSVTMELKPKGTLSPAINRIIQSALLGETAWP
jgi:hypothetical protein